ncbi:MAG: MBOAT family protein [Clostridia bacterium]|nr:MBOAT family protein [Clostridia bacterium]
MVFSSLLFIFAFLPLCLAAYSLCKNNTARNIILLIFSLIFYTWGEPVYVLLLISMTFCDWLMAILLDKTKGQTVRRLILFSACTINLGLIGVFKYTGFILTNVQNIFGVPGVIPKIILPIGISFYTFQLLSYVVDVYRKEVPSQKNFFWLLLYSSLFHQCIAGPIVRYKDVENDILNRRVNHREIAEGITRFTVGLGKKVLIANTCGSLADTLLVTDSLMASSPTEALAELSTRSAAGLWLGMLFYMLQIYLDFSAYSDMAIGMGLMTGFHFKENFNYPYIAKSVTDFWRRWHISLSTFFRDYVYIPLGGNRKGKLKTYRNLLIVWFLTGLWHGASWNFVLWGLFFFVFLCIEKLGLLKILEKTPSFFSRAYLLLVVYFGWILFRFSDFRFIPIVLKGLFCQNGNPLMDFETKTLFFGNIFFIVVALIAVTPAIKLIGDKLKSKSTEKKSVFVILTILNIILPLTLLVLSAISLVGDAYNPFIYFQF